MKRDGGFTLIELLIAMSILAALMALMASSLSFGATVWERSDAAAERTNRVVIAQHFLRREFEQAEPLFLPNTPRGRQVAFTGRPTSVRFVAGSLANASVGGPYLVSLHLEGSGQERRLAVSWRELSPDLEDFEAAKPNETSVLVEGVSNLDISYFGSIKNDRGNAWQSTWEERDELPLLVRVRLDFDGSTGQAWPEFVGSLPLER